MAGQCIDNAFPVPAEGFQSFQFLQSEIAERRGLIAKLRAAIQHLGFEMQRYDLGLASIRVNNQLI
jgi:hypothetical protein